MMTKKVGIPIHSLPPDWQIEPFENLVDNHDSKRVPIKSGNRLTTTGKYPYYGASGIIDHVDDYIFDGEYLLVSEDGANLLARTYPIAFIAKGKFWVNNHAHIVQAQKNKALNKYLKYYFDSIDISEFVTGAAQPKLSQKKLNSIAIPFPKIDEQRRIVNKLDALFEKLDKAIKLTEDNLEHLSHLMPAALNEVFVNVADKFKEVSLVKHVNFVGGSQPAKTEFSDQLKEGYVRLIQIRDYKSDNYKVYINKKNTSKFCDEDDVMIGRYGPPVFQILRGLKGAYNVALMKAEPDEAKITKDYLYWFLQNPDIQNYIIGISQRAAGQSGVNKTALEKYNIAIPPTPIQNSISNYLTVLNQKQKALNQEYQSKLKHLRALKASILNAAFNGEL